MHLLLQMPRVTRLLERYGLLCRWRACMVLDLRRLRERPTLPPWYQITTWEDSRIDEVAMLDYRSYAGTLDARLYRRYFSSVEGCAEMWREALNGKFGRFDPERSLLLLYEQRVVGDVMAATRGAREAFIGNLAVAPEHRGGQGRSLLLECLWRYRNAGCEHVSLAVTLENERALRLYESLGFAVSSRFPLVTRWTGSA